jgi:hypothetical protein
VGGWRGSVSLSGTEKTPGLISNSGGGFASEVFFRVAVCLGAWIALLGHRSDLDGFAR